MASMDVWKDRQNKAAYIDPKRNQLIKTDTEQVDNKVQV